MFFKYFTKSNIFIISIVHVLLCPSRVVEPIEPWCVMSHGDFHMWNMAFSQKDEAVKFFDLQLPRYTTAECCTN